MFAPIFFVCFVAALVSAQNSACKGPSAQNGDTISVHYSGYIDKSSATGVQGKMFDSSLSRKQPFKFNLGVGQVIRGWDEG